MIWITNKWAQIVAIIFAVMAGLSIRDRKIASQLKEQAKAEDNEKAIYIRRRIDAIGELHNNDIKYRD